MNLKVLKLVIRYLKKESDYFYHKNVLPISNDIYNFCFSNYPNPWYYFVELNDVFFWDRVDEYIYLNYRKLIEKFYFKRLKKGCYKITINCQNRYPTFKVINLSEEDDGLTLNFEWIYG